MRQRIIEGDCLERMAEMEASSIDAIVTDPPYGLSFMGKEWDHGVPGIPFWRGALRVAKPGAHLLAFGGSRTYHRLACAIEDAGWEIRDQIMWIYGTGFPKSYQLGGDWNGWGTALKPAHEPIVLARKPLIGTVAANVQAHGCGAINVDGCRVPGAKPDTVRGAGGAHGRYALIGAQGAILDDGRGRWPANVIHDGSEEVLSTFPDAPGQSGAVTGEEPSSKTNAIYGDFNGRPPSVPRGDSGSAARFFYCAKASRSERGADNKHPTVKPLALMRYLCRLVTPPGGTVLDPFAGSGTTVLAAASEGFACIGIEKDPNYAKIALGRLASLHKQQEEDLLS